MYQFYGHSSVIRRYLTDRSSWNELCWRVVI